MTTRQIAAIIGAGLAGVRAASALREDGFDGRILLFGDEDEQPYDRPPLSKDCLLGLREHDTIRLRPPQFYADNDIELHLGTRVVAIDLEAHRLESTAGDRVGFDTLLLATGSSARRLPVPGSELDGVFRLRTAADSTALAHAFAAAVRVVIIGAGWIGLEAAAAARAAGCEVSVVGRSAVPLQRVFGQRFGRIYRDLHTAHGVRILTGAQVRDLVGTGGRVHSVRLADGTMLDAEVVLVAVGAAPNTELADAAGLATGDGILVDEQLATSHPDVYAAGDVACAPYRWAGRAMRLQHWSAAHTQGPAAAAGILGAPARFDPIPYFFSDQYEMGMEYRGDRMPGRAYELVFRGDPDGGEYLAFWLDGPRVRAVMNVNTWDQGGAITALLRSGREVDPAALADPDVPLTEIAEPGTTARATAGTEADADAEAEADADAEADAPREAAFAMTTLSRLAEQGRGAGIRSSAPTLAGRTLLVVGLGNVGRAVAAAGRALGMTVLGVNHTGRGGGPDVDMVRPPWFLGDLLPRAHAVAVAFADADDTRGLLGAAAFERVRTGAVLIQVGGAGVVDTVAAEEALRTGILSHLAIGEAAARSLPADSPLRRHPQVRVFAGLSASR